jgi:hypothetical protein
MLSLAVKTAGREERGYKALPPCLQHILMATHDDLYTIYCNLDASIVLYEEAPNVWKEPSPFQDRLRKQVPPKRRKLTQHHKALQSTRLYIHIDSIHQLLYTGSHSWHTTTWPEE